MNRLEERSVQTNLAIEDATGAEGLPAHADLRRLLEYWNLQRGERAFPRRADIDPIDLAFMLDRIALTEVHAGVDDGPLRYRLRLVGTWWYRMAGFEATGTWLEDWPHANLHRITVEFYRALLKGAWPRFTRRDAFVDGQVLRYEIMLLPLSEDGENISMILTGIGPD